MQYFLLDLPKPIRDFPFFKPDGLGRSVFVTTPGLLLAIRADWRASRTWLLLGAAVAVLIPTLLYYGGGWLQFGYRYFLDSTPYVIALCGLAAARMGRIGPVWRVLIVFGVGVVAQTVLSKGAAGSPLAINISWGLAVAMGCYVAAGVTGAHLNPAVTIGFWAARRISARSP